MKTTTKSKYSGYHTEYLKTLKTYFEQKQDQVKVAIIQQELDKR